MVRLPSLPAPGSEQTAPVTSGDEVVVCCPFACGSGGVRVLSGFLVGTRRGPADFTIARRCPYCAVSTVSDRPSVSCPLCAGY
ncbi:hypothetical protein [Pseudonocardia pini]|uniref:hypothetical protein n=1 Tax=Pseudonocardia pini TaxID=2758030 RepID=UPI0015F04BBC|nr:hypothetical protein [Pseudonocardia pini]